MRPCSSPSSALAREALSQAAGLLLSPPAGGRRVAWNQHLPLPWPRVPRAPALPAIGVWAQSPVPELAGAWLPSCRQ